ncbi:MAG: Slp family lipoprotein [Gammaproteobacteria bacterium]|nr:Slp family lipoprotein [Gammaproteobacteria bacterium]
MKTSFGTKTGCRLFFCLAFVLSLSACVSYPDVVTVPEGTNLVEFETVNQVDSNKIGATARWSGVIAKVDNQKQSTNIDVLYYPAQIGGRPETSDEPTGRFRVKVNKFLDPEIYKKGKQITALGTLKEKETAKIGEYEYEYPTIDQAKVYLWPKSKPMPRLEYYYGWYGMYPRWYWHGGRRHIFIVGEERGKAKPAAQAKMKVNIE